MKNNTLIKMVNGNKIYITESFEKIEQQIKTFDFIKVTSIVFENEEISYLINVRNIVTINKINNNG